MNNNELKINNINLFVSIFFLFLGTFCSAVFFIFPKIFHFDGYLITPIAVPFSYIFTFIVYYFAVMKPQKQAFKFNYSAKRISLFLPALLMFIGMAVVAEAVIGLIPTQGGFWEKWYQEISEALLGKFEKYPVVTIFMVGIIAPFFEETFFRGFILKGLLNNNMKPEKAIAISALIFGVFHLNPWQMVGGFLLGLILGLVFYKTGTLFAGIIIHAINNLLNIAIYSQYGDKRIPEILNISKTLYFSIGLALLLIFGYLYLKLTRNYKWNSY